MNLDYLLEQLKMLVCLAPLHRFHYARRNIVFRLPGVIGFICSFSTFPKIMTLMSTVPTSYFGFILWLPSLGSTAHIRSILTVTSSSCSGCIDFPLH